MKKIALVVLLFFLNSSFVFAQDIHTLDQKEDIKSLVEKLEDEKKREELINDLNLLLGIQHKEQQEPSAEPGEFVSQFEKLDGFIKELDDFVESLPNFRNLIDENFKTTEQKKEAIDILLKFISIVFLGFLIEWLAHYFLRKPRHLVESKKEDSIPEKTLYLFLRTILDIIPIFAFAIVCFSLLPFVETSNKIKTIMIVFINANVIVRAILALARMVFVPNVASLRLLPIKTVDAHYIYIWIRRLNYVTLYGWFIAKALLIIQFPENGYQIFSKFVGFLIYSMLVVLILQNRKPVYSWLKRITKSLSGTKLSNTLSGIWHVIAILYITLIYSVWVLNAADGFEFLLENTILSFVGIISAVVIYFIIRSLVRRLFHLNQNLRNKFPSLEKRANKYLPIFEKIIKLTIIFSLLVFILEIWGVQSLLLIQSPLGQAIIKSLFVIICVLALAIFVWEMFCSWVDLQLEEKLDPDNARMRTLLPLAKNALMVVLIITTILIILSELNIEIAPLLAGAGVIGLAIGFGAQTLVKDVITGIFILVENTIEVGDFIEAAGHSGVVQSMTIRTLRLRDASGCVHTIPFSEVNTIMNHTKDYSYAVLELGVAYREDIEDVINVIKELGLDLQNDSEHGQYILEPIEVLGLDQFGDSAIVVKARFKTKPLKQWSVRRAFNLLVKKRFDELGIEMPFPHITLYMGEDKDGNAPPLYVKKPIINC